MRGLWLGAAGAVRECVSHELGHVHWHFQANPVLCLNKPRFKRAHKGERSMLQQDCPGACIGACHGAGGDGATQEHWV